MKTHLIALFLFCFCLVGFVNAQQQESEEQLIQSVIGEAKKQFVLANVQIPEAKANQFWKLYNSYESSRQKYSRAWIQLLYNYINAYQESDAELSKRNIKEYVKKSNALLVQLEKLKNKYYNKILTQVSAQTALQFLVVENYLASAVENKVYENLPF